jgi:hypothetical protein
MTLSFNIACVQTAPAGNLLAAAERLYGIAQRRVLGESGGVCKSNRLCRLMRRGIRKKSARSDFSGCYRETWRWRHAGEGGRRDTGCFALYVFAVKGTKRGSGT